MHARHQQEDYSMRHPDTVHHLDQDRERLMSHHMLYDVESGVVRGVEDQDVRRLSIGYLAPGVDVVW